MAAATLAGLGAINSADAQVPPATGPGLARFGPIDPVQGFPMYYEDRLGLRLQLCQNPAFCLFARPNPALPMAFPTNYSGEQFYYHVGTTGAGAPGALLTYEHALEATFVSGEPTAGEQIVFSRFRLRVTGLTNGSTYTVTHPYGTVNYVAGVDGGPGEINVTVDIGPTAGAFNLALAGNVGPFLVPLGYVTGLPGSYIGDAVTEGPVQGSPFGTNYLRIDGQGIGASFPANAVSATRVQWNNFALQGQLAAAGGVGVTAAHVAKQATPAENMVDVWGVADTGVNLQASVPGVAGVPMKEIGTTGKYFGRVPLAAGALTPASVTVTNLSDVPPRSATKTGLTDLVTINSATYITGNNVYITANSSDKVGNPILTATADGYPAVTLISSGAGVASGSIALAAGAVPPESVSVTSSGGGTATLPILVESPTPVFANAGLDQSVAAGAAVSLSGAASSGPITSYAWSQLSGPAITLTGANTASASFSAPNLLTASVITLQLSVAGAFGQSSTDTVLINVAAVPPVFANAGIDQSVAAGAAVTVSAAGSTGPISTYAWSQTAGPAVTLTGANSPSVSFNAPNPLVASVITLSLTVNGAFGQTSTSTVNINVAAVPAVFANAGADQLVPAGALVNLSGIASSGPITGYAWSTNDPTIVLTGGATAAASFTAPSLPVASFVTVSLTVTGAFGQTSTDTAIVAVAAVVVPPAALAANAGVDQNVGPGALVSVSGAASSGPNPIVSYAWSQLSGPAITLSGANTASASFAAPSLATASIVTLQLTVTDSVAATASDIVAINVSAVPALLANAGLDQNVAAGVSVALSGSATGGSGTIASYAWSQLSGPAITLLGAGTASASFAAPSLAAASVITLQLTVTDSLTTTASDIVVINVAAVPPVLAANAGLDQNVAAGARVTLSGAASTGATGFAWTQTGGAAVVLTGAATATLSFTAPSAATASVLTFTLTVRNAAGATATDIVVVNVAPVADTITITQAQYTVSTNNWRLAGTSTQRLGQTITIYLGATGNTLRRIGTAVVAANGLWQVQTANRSGPAPVAGDTQVWASSTLGGTASRAFTRG